MTMTDDRPTVIPGYGENPAQEPPADAGGSIAQVEAARTHADPRLLKEKCNVPGCGKLITKKNMDQHKRNVHQIFKRKRVSDGAEPMPPKPPRQPKVTADEVVMIVVQMRWATGVPVDKVPALLEWQRATERFFSE